MNDEYRHINSLTSLDAEYRFGQPKLYLAPHELARLTILRSKLGDTPAERAAECTQPVDAQDRGRKGGDDARSWSAIRLIENAVGERVVGERPGSDL